jgi:hypothetical protein
MLRPSGTIERIGALAAQHDTAGLFSGQLHPIERRAEGLLNVRSLLFEQFEEGQRVGRRATETVGGSSGCGSEG